MGEGLKEMLHGVSSPRAEDYEDLGWLSEESDHDDDDDAADAGDDATTITRKSSDRSLLELSSLVSQLPIKRGLSKYYKGKSQSFSSFTDVGCVEDLAKKETPYKRKATMKPSRSYAGGLDEQTCGSPAAAAAAAARPPNNKSVVTTKKVSSSRGNLACSSSMARAASGGSFFSSGKPPHIPMQKNI